MECNDCEIEPKKQKQKRILPQWIIDSNKKIIIKNKETPCTEKIVCAKPKREEKKNEKVNLIKKMFEKKMENNKKDDEMKNNFRKKMPKLVI